jgi:hypothetical protein
MRTPIEAQRRYGGPWKPAELSDEVMIEILAGETRRFLVFYDQPEMAPAARGCAPIPTGTTSRRRPTTKH